LTSGDPKQFDTSSNGAGEEALQAFGTSSRGDESTARADAAHPAEVSGCGRPESKRFVFCCHLLTETPQVSCVFTEMFHSCLINVFSGEVGAIISDIPDCKKVFLRNTPHTGDIVSLESDKQTKCVSLCMLENIQTGQSHSPNSIRLGRVHLLSINSHKCDEKPGALHVKIQYSVAQCGSMAYNQYREATSVIIACTGDKYALSVQNIKTVCALL